MFAQVYKKDSSLQDEEYAECYAFEKGMLLSKNELETYSSEYDENIIKTFHQKQSSYAQSEGYHSYVSSNDSAIITPFSDSRSQTDNDFNVPTDENVFSPKHCHAGSSSRLATDTTKWRNSYSSSCCATKIANYEKHNNSQHIAHSARVQTPQRHHSETILYLDESKAPQQQFYNEAVASHSAVDSQLRKLYPISTYSVQPQAINMCDGDELSSAYSSKYPASKNLFEIESKQTDSNSHCVNAEYTFLDPSKKRIVSNQNLKVIQKQALISYYERHHSTWRSEPQLSLNSSSAQPQPRPRLPTPTSCRLASSSDSEECRSADNAEAFATKLGNNHDSTNGIEDATNFSWLKNKRLGSPSLAIGKDTDTHPIAAETRIPVDDRVPQLPPKKAHLRMATAAARCLSSPELPPPPSPPPPPPMLEEEIFVPDEPFPPPPAETAFICDTWTNKAESTSNATIHQLGTNDSQIPCDTTTRHRTNAITTATTAVVVVSKDLQHSTLEFNSRTTDIAAAQKCNAVRLSSCSFRSYVRPTNNQNTVTKTDRFSDGAVLRSDALNEKAHNNHYKLSQSKDEPQNATKPIKNAEANQIEQKVKAIRTLFEDKFRKSINSKNFQFPSFSFIHSEKFPSRLDPRFPRTSYQLSQTHNHRDIRENEKVGVYKRRNASPSAKIAHQPSIVVDSLAEVNRTLLLAEGSPSSHSVCVPFTEFPSSSTSVGSATAVQKPAYTQPSENDENDECRVRSTPIPPPPPPPPPPLPPPLPKLANEDDVKSADNQFKAKTFNERLPYVPRCSQSSPCNADQQENIPNVSSTPFNPLRSQSHFSQSGAAVAFDNSSLDFSNQCSTSSESNTRNRLRCNKQSEQQNVNILHSSRPICSKNSTSTIDAASQTEVDIVCEKKNSYNSSYQQIYLPQYTSTTMQEMEDEIEQLRREVITYLTPTNGIYKILAPRSEAKKSVDYLKNVFQASILQIPCFPKNLSTISEPEDTRLQEGSIKYRKAELEIAHKTVQQNEACDNSQILPSSIACSLLQKKKNLSTHLIQKLDTLKVEQNAVCDERLKNEELGDAISEKVLRLASPRETSKYKSYIQEIGQITNLLLGLGERLAKIENSLYDLPSDSSQHEKESLRSKRDQLLRQLEDAKELKKSIDKRGFAVISLLQKYFNEQELDDYQRFIQTKCRLLIFNRNLNEKIFHFQQQVNALKEDEIEGHASSLLQFIS